MRIRKVNRLVLPVQKIRKIPPAANQQKPQQFQRQKKKKPQGGRHIDYYA